MKKAIIYCKIPTPKKDPRSIEAIAKQRDPCLQFIKESGKYELAPNGVYCDYPNPKIKTVMPEYKRILRRLTVAKEIRAVVVYSPDKLSAHFQRFTVLRASLKAAGAELISVNASPEQAYAVTLFDALKEFAPDARVAKVKKAHAQSRWSNKNNENCPTAQAPKQLGVGHELLARNLPLSDGYHD
jgi:hypothetical protein